MDNEFFRGLADRFKERLSGAGIVVETFDVDDLQ